METLPTIQDSNSCSCPTCQSMCRRPCWPTPSDVRRLIEFGESNKLMLDYWVGSFASDSDNVYIVCPANPGYEGGTAPEVDFMSMLFGSPLHVGCVFQKDGLCALHDRGLKPAEGRAAHHSIHQPELHENVARYWDTDEGRMVVGIWCELENVTNPYLTPNP